MAKVLWYLVARGYSKQESHIQQTKVAARGILQAYGAELFKDSKVPSKYTRQFLQELYIL
jgi:hypothetical protein